jgi:hypothetical protein
MGATESTSDVFSTTSFILLVLLGLGFGLPPTDYEMEVDARRVVLRCAGVGGAVMVTLMHLKGPTTLLPCLRKADLGGRHAVMRYDGEGMRTPFLRCRSRLFFQI